MGIEISWLPLTLKMFYEIIFNYLMIIINKDIMLIK
jgi:hypothetical protein